MRALGFFLLWTGLFACGQPKRNNPLDAEFKGGGEMDAGIEIIALLPLREGEVVSGQRLAEIRYAVSAEDIAAPLTGEMNLVGTRARARVRGLAPGAKRVFRVDVFDRNQIRTFAASDTLDLSAEDFSAEAPRSVLLNLERLTGSVEITSTLPPEVALLEVIIAADGDTTMHSFEVQGPFAERIGGVPTGTAIPVLLQGRDAQGQILVLRRLAVDVRESLLARLGFQAQTGAVEIVALFPPYIPIAPVDRFGEAAGTFFRRSDRPGLPGPDEPIDFDRDFLRRGFGPNGEPLLFYQFDAHPPVPAPVYVVVDERRGRPIPGQLLIFDLLPGDEGYSDIWQINEVPVDGRTFQANSLSSLQALLEGGFEIQPTNQAMNCVLVPAGSSASRRFDPQVPTQTQNGWYRDRIVKYLLFENPASAIQVDFGGKRLNTPQMFGFFDNDRDPRDGFFVDEQSGGTHNVYTRLPGQEGYSPLWVLTVFRRRLFDRVRDVPTALDQARNEENIIPPDKMLHLNNPIVAVGGAASQ